MVDHAQGWLGLERPISESARDTWRTVSQANVEIVKQTFAAFGRRDLDAVAATMDPHVLVRTDPRWLEQHVYGREAWIAWAQGLLESGGPDVRIEELVDLGDRVLVRVCWIMRGQHSGVEGEFRTSQILTFREGRTILIEYFFGHEQALKALEMRE